MTSRERVWAALNHKEPDRVPLDLSGTNCTSLTKVVYENLRNYLGLAPDLHPHISSRIQGVVRAPEDILSHYAVDTRSLALRPPLVFKGKEMPDGSYYDEFGIRRKLISNYYEITEFPLAAISREDLDSVTWPDPYDKGRVAGLKEEARRLYETTDYCLVADIPSQGPFEGSCKVRGYEQFCVDLHEDPVFAEALMDKFADTLIALWDVFLSEAGDYVQVVAMGDDVGMQTGLLISPAMYRRFVKPRFKRVCDFIHSRTKARIFYHSCGGVFDLVPDFIEAGVDILNPLQRGAAGMDLVRLKREFGKDLCFWGGGIDVQTQLPVYSPDQIEEEVKRTLDIMAPGGGFVFFPTHNIQADVTPDRVDKLFRSVIRHGKYSTTT
jgi:uroporphyrinogen decarboxylase